MKKIFIAIAFFICISGYGGQDKFPILKGPYLGQKPPGMKPAVFAPGIIPTGAGEGSSVFSKDLKTFIFNRYDKGTKNLYITRLTESGWSNPEVLKLGNSKYHLGDFTLSPDGKTFFFSSRMPTDDHPKKFKRSNIWKVSFSKIGWGKITIIPSPISTYENHESYPSIANNGTLYFFARDRGGFGKSDLYLSRLVNGEYIKIENMGKTLNTEHHEWDPYIAPDESYLIFCSTKEDSFGEDDLYISFKKKDSSWSKPINMGSEINSPASENRPYVTPDGKYFIYTSTMKHRNADNNSFGNGKRDIYWIDSKILEKLKQKNRK